MTTDYIRKSMLESYEFCPQQFFKQWIMGCSKEPNQKMLIGTRFHDWANTFFEYSGVIDPDYWGDLIPTEFNEEEVEMVTWFIDYQRTRYQHLKQNDRLDEFAPIYKELFMVCDAIKIKSTLDGAEWVNKSEGTVCLLEYKTGAKIDAATAFRQLAFYAVLWTASGNPGKIVKLRLINPRLKVVQETDYTEQLQNTALKRVAKLRDAIDRSYFPYICSDGKFAACKLCGLEELPKLFPSDGFKRFTDIYGVTD